MKSDIRAGTEREDCKEMIKEEWALIGQEEIVNLIRSMSTRIECAATAGGHTMY